MVGCCVIVLKGLVENARKLRNFGFMNLRPNLII
jgi:hypothetical protein